MSEKSLPYKIITPTGSSLHRRGNRLLSPPCKEELGMVVLCKLTFQTTSLFFLFPKITDKKYRQETKDNRCPGR